MNLPQEVVSYNICDGDFGCVKFIKQTAAEYDFSYCLPPKAMFLNF
jgi:hypothetical protein